MIYNIPLPEFFPKRIAFKVKPIAEKMLRKGHPWIFESAITKQKSEGNAGDVAIIYDKKNNKFLALGLYDPFSPIRIKILQVLKSAPLDEVWFEQKIKDCSTIRQPYIDSDHTNSYRLIHGENDGLPGLVVDMYAGVLVLKLYSAIWLPYLKIILPALLKITSCENIVLRLSRNLQKQTELLGELKDGQVIYGTLENDVVVFKEHNLLFKANVINGHKTGYFLDHRANRKMIGTLSKGKTVLDVFAYAGGFSVHALAGGAREVSSLDISPHALEMAKENVAINNLQAHHKTITADAFDGLEKLYQSKKKFDIVIVDPPSFAKSNDEIERALKSYARLTKSAIQLVERSGTLLMASCSSRVKADAFFEVVFRQLDFSKRKYKEFHRSFHDIDHPIGFPEGAYLKSIYFRLD